MTKKKSAYFFSQKLDRIEENARTRRQPFLTISRFGKKKTFAYPYESDNTILFPILILVFFTFVVGFIGISFNGVDLDILSKWLTPSINLLHPNSNYLTDWSEFVKDAVFSVSLAYLGIIIAFFFYKPPYSPFSNFDLVNSLIKTNLKIIFSDKIKNGIYAWSYNRGYIDAFYATYLTGTVRRVSEFTHLFDRQVVDGITNGVGLMSFFVGEAIKSIGGGRISSYIFLYSSYVSVFLLITYFLSRR